MQGKKETNEEEEFSVRMCSDLVIEALYYANRNRMTKLEHVGRRFNEISERFFEQKPVVRYDLVIQLGFGHACNLTPGNRPINELSAIPPFLRFRKIGLYSTSSMWNIAIEEQCKFMRSRLLLLNSALKEPQKFSFSANVSEHRADFQTELSVMNYLQKQLLPIVDTSRAYEFHIGIYTTQTNDRENEVANIVAGLLQTPATLRACDVLIGLSGNHMSEAFLPIEEIANWLVSSGSVNGYVRRVENRQLRIKICCNNIKNVKELVERVKMKFREAKSPTSFFTFRCCGVKIVGLTHETITNKKTDEELSISPVIFCGGGIEITKTAKRKLETSRKVRSPVCSLPPEIDI